MTEPINFDKLEKADAHDDIDVLECQKDTTDDGRGGAVVPKTDFVSYEAAENVTAYEPEEDN